MGSNLVLDSPPTTDFGLIPKLCGRMITDHYSNHKRGNLSRRNTNKSWNCDRAEVCNNNDIHSASKIYRSADLQEWGTKSTAATLAWCLWPQHGQEGSAWDVSFVTGLHSLEAEQPHPRPWGVKREKVVVTYLCSTLRANETAPFHTPDKLNPVKGPSSDGWHTDWWVEIWLHKCYGSLGKEKRDWQKHSQNEKLSKIWLHTFNKQVGRAILNLKHPGYYALCWTSSQGLALSSLQDLLPRTMNYNSKRHCISVISSVFLHFGAVKNGQT